MTAGPALSASAHTAGRIAAAPPLGRRSALRRPLPTQCACDAAIALQSMRPSPWQPAGAAAEAQATGHRLLGLGGAQMRAAVPPTVSTGAVAVSGQAGGRALHVAQSSRPFTSGRPRARVAACLRDQHHGQQQPARWQQADAPPAPAVDRRAASRQPWLCRRRQQQQRQQQQQAGQAQRLRTVACALPPAAASGGAADHEEAAGERALHPTALTAL